ncbi:MAG TPA: cell division protein FtsZ [Caulobacteraceae bacterium]|nr:cell division protein FtsZ [Caulobacteraceae bacterium]
MSIHLSAPTATELKPRIVVFGVGGAGGNAVNNMIESGLGGVEFVVANTDAQQLAFSKTERRIQLGVTVTQGLGAGAHPEIGMSAAEESAPEISDQLDGAHMVFITAGMGGGTGTGAAPIIAKAARERGILTVGVVTKPFTFEGRHRMRLADAGIAELQRYVDTLIVIPNQNLFRIANERTTFAEAFGMADQVLHSGVRSITDLMVLPGLINLDFADVRTVMTEMGKAMMGTGEASGEDRALLAAQNAIANPLLDEVSLKGAKAVLVNVTGGLDMTLLEVDEAANAIAEQVDPEANIIFGAAFDPSLDGKVRVSVVATGMDGHAIAAIEPKAMRSSAQSAPAQSAPQSPQLQTLQPQGQPQTLQPVTIREPQGGARELVAAVAAAVGAEPAPETAPVSVAASFAERYASEPEIVRPAVSVEPQQSDLYADARIAPVAQPVAAREPLVARIDDTVREEPLSFDDRRTVEDSRQQKGGWLSLFGGRGRAEQPPPPLRDYRGDPGPVLRARAAAGGSPVAHPMEEVESDAGEDLEIPSFLRRLAN